MIKIKNYAQDTFSARATNKKRKSRKVLSSSQIFISDESLRQFPTLFYSSSPIFTFPYIILGIIKFKRPTEKVDLKPCFFALFKFWATKRWVNIFVTFLFTFLKNGCFLLLIGDL